MRLNEKGSTSKVPSKAILALSLLFFAKASLGYFEKVHGETTPDPVHWAAVMNGPKGSFIVENPERKPILYEFYSSADENSQMTNLVVLRHVEIVRLIRRKFVAVQVSDEKVGGHTPAVVSSLVRRFSIGRVPALVVTTADGKELARVEGYKPASIVYQMLTTALSSPHVNTRQHDEGER